MKIKLTKVLWIKSLVLLLLIISGSNSQNFSSQEKQTQKVTKPLITAILGTLGRDDSQYHIRKINSGTYMAKTPLQKFETTFSKEGISVRTQNPDSQSWEWSIKLLGIGYGQNIAPVSGAEPNARANRIEYRRNNFTEWYVNSPFGLEQGFTIDSPLRQRAKGTELVLELNVSGDLLPNAKDEGKIVVWNTKEGESALNYGQLYAFDSMGNELPARIAASRDKLSIIIDDTAAIYPITIDPTIVTEDLKLLASDGTSDDFFGVSVAISNDIAVVGAFLDHGNASQSGSAYVFERDLGGPNNWGERKKLLASDGAAQDLFGVSVAISNDTIVVGAVHDNDKGSLSGSAYVFERKLGGANNWGQRKKLLASDGAANDEFGASVAISNDTVVVGADEENESLPGSAYVFERNLRGANNWGERKKLLASDGADDDLFGRPVAISNDTIVVGAPFDDDNGNFSGSAYVFERNFGGANNWGERKKLLASDSSADDFFGISVAISSDTIVVGASSGDEMGVFVGSAYVFERNLGGANNWGERKKLLASDGAHQDVFGDSVAISCNKAVVGALADDDNGNLSGSAYVFERNLGGANNWGERAKLLASDGEADEFFGNSVAISGDTIVVGAVGDDDKGTGSGSAYVFITKEGPIGDPTCSDSIDNDGDGNIDLDDSNCTAFLSFPLRGSMPGIDDNLTPYTATINSVFDHSQSFPYDVDNVVTAYTGEHGEFVQGDPVRGCRSLVLKRNFGFKNMDGDPFAVNDHYSGGGTTCPSSDTGKIACNSSPCNRFLFYDGHPGIDYRASGGINCQSKDIGTEVYAVADGTIRYPKSIPGLNNAQYYTTLELIPDGLPEYRIYYLHLSTHPTLKNEIIFEGNHVCRGDLIGRTGCGGNVDPHLHFEVQKNRIPVDPYGWEGGTICPDCDPYSQETNVPLWKLD